MPGHGTPATVGSGEMDALREIAAQVRRDRPCRVMLRPDGVQACPAIVATGAAPEQLATRLETLAAELATFGWATRLDAPPGRVPGLQARSPDLGAAALSERIYVLPRSGGSEWTYWWPWTEPIAHSPAAAAVIITRALRMAGAR